VKKMNTLLPEYFELSSESSSWQSRDWEDTLRLRGSSTIGRVESMTVATEWEC
jgi:hypothetical protein